MTMPRQAPRAGAAGGARARRRAVAAALLRLGARNALRHRTRNALLAASLLTASALLVVAAAVGRGIREQLVRRLVSIESGAILVTVRDTALRADAEALRALAAHAEARVAALPHVTGVRPRASVRGLLMVRGRSENVQIRGVRAPAESALVAAGLVPRTLAGPAGAAGVAVSDAVLRALQARTGDPCILLATTRLGSLEVQDCTIAHAYPATSRATGGLVYAPLAAVQRLMELPGVTELVVDVDQLTRAPAVLGAARAALSAERADGRLNVTGYWQRAGLAGGIARANTTYMLALVGALVFVAAVGVATAVLNGIREREPELGTLLALGWSGRALLAALAAEALVVALPAAITGALLGMAAALGAGAAGIDVGNAAALAFGSRVLRPALSWTAVLLAPAVCTLLPLLFATLAARRVARLQPLEALRGAAAHGIVAALLLAAPAAARAQSPAGAATAQDPPLARAQAMLARFDEDIFSATMRYRVALTTYAGAKAERSYRLLAYKRGTRLRLEFEDPAVERGRRVLNDGDGLWMYMPRTGMSIRLSSKQAFMGSDASNQDLLRLSLREDYEIAGVERTAPPAGLGTDSLLRITLAAKRPGEVYPRVVLYASADGRLPRAQDYAVGSGRPIRRLTYDGFADAGGAPFPRQVTIENLLAPGRRTILAYSDVRRGDVPPAAFFTLASLRR
ncbi:MAG: outer membrane lipoprotein-sorting protein [Gemmatimonadaceae bacterium]